MKIKMLKLSRKQCYFFYFRIIIKWLSSFCCPTLNRNDFRNLAFFISLSNCLVIKHFLEQYCIYADDDEIKTHLALEEAPKAVTLSNKEPCDIDTNVIVPSEHWEITDEEEIEVGWDALVLSKDVSGTLEVAGSSAVRNGKMNHEAKITETAAGIKTFNVTKKTKRHNQLCFPFQYQIGIISRSLGYWRINASVNL